jgi:3-hydroxyacyl-[acyl-carrier-protein] dehydratase
MQEILNNEQIRNMLPHRWPFLLLDRVIELVPGKRGVGIKNVSINEPFFQGHFPMQSIMPGVLIVESLAQLTAVVYCSGAMEAMKEAGEAEADVNMADRVGYLAAIRNFKFKKLVTPGDQLILKAAVGGSLGVLSTVQVSAFVQGECVAEGTLAVSQKPE